VSANTLENAFENMLTHMHKGDTHCVYHLVARVQNFTGGLFAGATGALDRNPDQRKDKVSQK
jgi:hypothetical protein